MRHVTDQEQLRRAFEHKTVLITGASRGLGLLLAGEVGRLGANVVICARRGDELRRATEWLRGFGIEALALECDVSSRDAVNDLVQRIRESRGAVDVLFNCAGIIQVGPVESMRLEDFETALGVMYWGTVYPTLAILPEMLSARQGTIVNITSIGGKLSVPHLLPYSSAKAAAVAFSEGLRAEVRGKNVQVVTVVPGLMRTGSHLQATIKGGREPEYAWFSLGATFPFVSMDAERAARRIVAAAARQESELILSLPANLAARFHGLFPGITANLMALAERFILPASSSDSRPVKGWAVQARAGSRVLDALTAFGRSAARRFNQVSD